MRLNFVRAMVLAMLPAVMFIAGCAEDRPYLGDLSATQEPAYVSREKILVATTRMLVPSGTPDGRDVVFDYIRAPSMNYAQMTVGVPPHHQEGKIEMPGLDPNPAYDFTTFDIKLLKNKQAFLSDLNAELARKKPGQRDVFLFVHGFNNTFAEALFRTAQIRHDFNIKAVPVMFSWPSRGELTGYAYDRDSVLFSRDELVSLLQTISQSRAERVLFLAHSMGGMMTMEALRQAKLTNNDAIFKKIEPLILAAPDIDVDVFQKQIKVLHPLPFPTMVMVSRDDEALALSEFLYGGMPRVGEGTDDKQLTQMGITVLDLSKVPGGDSIRHSTYATSPALINFLRKPGVSRTMLNDAVRHNHSIAGRTGQLFGNAADLVIHLPSHLTSGG